jgi:hypothetical protein
MFMVVESTPSLELLLQRAIDESASRAEKAASAGG